MTSPARGPRLRLIAVNDVYSLENLPRLAGLIRHFSLVDPADRLVTTLAGDFVSPSLLSSLDKGRGMVDCLNAVPVDIVSFGNHEDEIGLDALQARAREFKGTWLNSNVPGFEPALPDHLILEVTSTDPTVRSVRVGLVGVVMHDPATYRRVPFAGQPVAHANRTVLRWAEKLIRDGCSCVIPMTHQFLADDRELAQLQSAVPFPVILGGHEHVPFLEQQGPTWIVKAGSEAALALVIDLCWPVAMPTSGPDLPAVTIVLEAVAGYPEVPELRARVNHHMSAVRELMEATLIDIPSGHRLSSVGTRMQQTSLGTLLCTLVKDTLAADCCWINGGGIRGNRTYTEQFTYGDLEGEVPFDNEVVVARLPGNVLRETMVKSRAHAPKESGGFLQSDDKLICNTQGDVTLAGLPLQDDTMYQVALVRELLTGMDHVETLLHFARQHPDSVPPAGSGRGLREILVTAFSNVIWRKLGGFGVVDRNGDGQVTTSELADSMKRAFHQLASPTVVGLVMHSFDTNRDELISKEEAPESTKV